LAFKPKWDASLGNLEMTGGKHFVVA
jgi:hypothetical protein